MGVGGIFIGQWQITVLIFHHEQFLEAVSIYQLLCKYTFKFQIFNS